jgi:hypothetical protein
MPDYSTSFTKYRAYNVTPETLAEIVNAAKKFIEASPTITVYLEDDHNIEDNNLDALIADSYVRGKSTKRIAIDGRKTFDPLVSRSISVNFEVDLLQTVAVRIVGERDRSLTVRREIEIILGGAEFWYAPIFWPRSSLLLFQLSIFIPVVVASAAGVFVTWLFGGEIRANFISAWALLASAAFTAAYFGLKDQLFPKLTFDIGRSANRVQSARYWRNFVLTSILIGIVLKLAIDHFLK